MFGSYRRAVAATSDVTIRRVRADEGLRLKQLRLSALLDTPSAFGRTHAEESAYPDELWHDRATRAAEGGAGSITLVAETAAGDWVGLVGGYRPDGDDGAPELVSMWVAPDARGTGVASDLVETVADWARATGAHELHLWVTIGNDRAAALYRRCGFVELDDFQPLPSDPCKNEQRMRLDLSAG